MATSKPPWEHIIRLLRKDNTVSLLTHLMCDVRMDKLAIKIKDTDFRMYASYIFDKCHFLVDYLDRQTRKVSVYLITLSEILQDPDGIEHQITESSLDEDSDDSLILMRTEQNLRWCFWLNKDWKLLEWIIFCIQLVVKVNVAKR